MADTHDSPDQAGDPGHHGPNVKAYLVVGGALAGFTIVSFGVNSLVRADHLSANAGFWIILSVAIIKATLVVFYFMHLMSDWKKVGFMIVPALILGAMMSVVLMPDIVIAWHPRDEATPVPEVRPEGGGGSSGEHH
jgi:caa(3)-type oxidase subunit IV